MIPTPSDVTVEASGKFVEAKMGIDTGSLAHVLEVLRKSLYKDPISAPLREYATNGMDGHTLAGTPNKPIDVFLPTRFNPTLRIRDFGVGLSTEDVHSIYSMYGASTKRNSNDFNGQLGLGCKSGFAYSESFVIISVQDGVKTTYNAYIDESKEGRIAEMGKQDTDEANGVEIKIAVRPEDVQRFHDRAVALYTYFDVKPNVHNLNTGVTLDKPKSTLARNNWRITPNNRSVAVMANVAYPIDINQFDDNFHKAILSTGVEITFPTGKLEFSASREELRYTPFTKQNLLDALNQVKTDVVDEIQTKFAKCQNLWEAKVLYHKIFNDMGNLGNRLSSSLANTLMWKGKPIGGDFFQNKDKDVIIQRYSEAYRRNQVVESSKVDVIRCREKAIVIINDLNTKGGSTARIGELHTTKKFDEAYCITFVTDDAKKDFYKTHDFSTIPVILQSTLPLPVRTVATNKKHNLKCFVFDKTCSGGSNSEYWNTADIDKEDGNGVYLVIDRFEAKINSSYTTSPYNLKALLIQLEQLGIKIDNLIGVKPSAIDKKPMGEDWVTLTDYVKAELTKKMTAENLYQTSVDYHHYEKEYNGLYDSLIPHIAKLDATKPLGLYLSALVSMKVSDAQRKRVTSFTSVANGFYITLKDDNVQPSHDLPELKKAVFQSYPLIRSFNAPYYIREFAENIVDYAVLADK